MHGEVRNQEELMLRKPLLLVTAAGAFIMIQGAAVAQTQCGGIWAARCNLPKGPKKADAKAKAQEATPQASANADVHASANSAVNGATPPNASATGAANANANSAAATDTTGAAAAAGAGALGAAVLTGVTTGQTVKTSAGAALGTVTKVVKGPDGAVSQVIVTSAQGKSFPVAAGKISLSGGVLIVSDSSDQ